MASMATAIAMPLAAATFGLSVPSIVKLLNYEWLLDEKVKDGLASLQADLKSMHTFLGEVTSLAPDLQLSPQVKLQADEVSDMSHSIGTCLHSFLVRIESSKEAHIPEASKQIINHDIDDYIKGTRIKVKELGERHSPYPPKSSLESTCTKKLDPRILAKYKREPNPVGIASAITNLTNMLLSEDNHAIISIVGMGGIGKTTLAQAVYHKMKGDLNCGAFVLIGQRADPEKVLKDIFDGLCIDFYGKEPDQHQLATSYKSCWCIREKLTSLEELWLYSAEKSPDFAVGLRKLSKMRVLVIHFDEIHDSMQEALVESLHELKKLQVLQVWSGAEEKVRLDCWEGCVPSPEIRRLLLFGVILPRLTPWIHPLCAPKLSKLVLQVEILTAEDMKILGEMSSLRSLYLHSNNIFLSYTTGRDEFKGLKYINTNIELVCGDGALPVIQELEVGNIRVGTNVGLQGNMPLLERASYHLNCHGCDIVEVKEAEAALWQASQAHPNHPTLSIKRFYNLDVHSCTFCRSDLPLTIG
ncbi:unnamed protein product [Alopecurus aequalis]